MAVGNSALTVSRSPSSERLHWREPRLGIEPLTDTGTHRGAFLGVAATGRAVTLTELALYRVENGLIGRVWVAADNATLLDQLRR